MHADGMNSVGEGAIGKNIFSDLPGRSDVRRLISCNDFYGPQSGRVESSPERLDPFDVVRRLVPYPAIVNRKPVIRFGTFDEPDDIVSVVLRIEAFANRPVQARLAITDPAR